MDFIARVNITVDVPFSAAVDELGPREVANEETGAMSFINAPQYEKSAEKISKQRVAAAKHAEKEIVKAIRDAVGKHGKIVDESVQEVREA